jgi:hypothetical protein
MAIMYPFDDLDKTGLIGALGSYWGSEFPDAPALKAILEARQVLFDQTRQMLAETEDIAGRRTVPVSAMRWWQPLNILANASDELRSSLLVHGENKALYGVEGNPPYDAIFTYGGGLTSEATVFALPSGVTDIAVIFNRLTTPTRCWIGGIDFKVVDGNLIFMSNVFDDPEVERTDVITNSVPDRRATLWAYGIIYDKAYMWNHYGWVVGVQSASSEAYNKAINALWDSHTGGPSFGHMTDFLSGLTDTPICQTAGEKVQQIISGKYTYIVTEYNVYSVSTKANVTVAVGDTLKLGQTLCDIFILQPLTYISDTSFRHITTATSTIVSGLGLKNDTLSVWQPNRVAQTCTGNADDLGVYVTTRPYADYFETGTGIDVVARWGAVTRPHRGPFVNESVTLTRDRLPEHDFLTLSVDLLVLGRWRGITDATAWRIYLDGQLIFETNFSNVSGHTQAYPDQLGQGVNPAGSGCDYQQTERYYYPDTDSVPDSTYKITVTAAHRREKAEYVFECEGLPDTRIMVYNYKGTADYPPLREPMVEVLPNELRVGYLGEFTAAEYTTKFNTAYPLQPPRPPLPAWGFYPPAEYRPPLWPDSLNPHGAVPIANFAFYWAYTYGGYSPISGIPWLKYATGADAYPEAAWGLYDVSLTAIKSNRSRVTPLSVALDTLPELYGISIGPSFTSHNLVSPLFFKNADVPLQYVGPDAAGRVEVRFEISGFPNDIEQFWSEVHAKGVAQGITLANYLDTRLTPMGDPGPDNLPATVNPMRLVLRHIMGYNLVVVKIRSGLEGRHALDTRISEVLRDITPPQTAVLIFVELNIDDEIVDLSASESVAVGDSPSVTESVDLAARERIAVTSIEGVLL